MLRVWIELEKPKSDEQAQEIVSAANAMMKKLGIEHDVFGWWQDKGKYIHIVDGETGAFAWLNDRGDWFNLEYLSK